MSNDQQTPLARIHCYWCCLAACMWMIVAVNAAFVEQRGPAFVVLACAVSVWCAHAARWLWKRTKRKREWN